jgi:outer membrane receptor for ferrienterochelin and colicin
VFAADAPALVQPTQSDSQPDVIEVVATKSQQTQKIDRRTYRIQENPHSAQKDSLQLLRGLPAVTITSDDDVQLLGSSGVTILVDGGPVHGDARLYLRTLHGSDIERIEIITNPSAQYSAQGTGGIINFVLRKKKDHGLSGSTSGEVSSFGAVVSVNAVRLKKGKWTYEAQAQGWHGGVLRSRYESLRSFQLAPEAPPTVNTQEGRSAYRVDFGSLNGNVTYDLDDRTSLSAGFFSGTYKATSSSRTEWQGVTSDFESFSERQRVKEGTSYRGAGLSLNHRGKKDGETLQVFATIYDNPSQFRRARGNWADGAPYAIDSSNTLSGTWAKVDWNHPIGKQSILSLGSEWTFQRRGHGYRFIGEAGQLETFEHFAVEDSKGAAWATFQQGIGGWTVMPGLRIERLDRKVSRAGSGSVRVVRTNAFPTFHLQKALTKIVNMTLSYSKRISRPDDDYLRPYPIVRGALAVSGGNPDLRDQNTDAFEVNLHYHRKKLDGGVIIYDRETHGLWSPTYAVRADGSTFTNWINAGRQSDRGAQIDVSTPLLPRLKAMASINLFGSRVPINGLIGLSSYESFRYTGNATLEWTGRERRDRPGDVGQLQLQYQSRSRAFETRSAASYSLNVSWTHSLTRSISLTATVNRLGRNRSRLEVSAPLVQSRTVSRFPGPEFKIKLVKTFGGAKAPPPAGAPPVPIPG